MSKLDRIYQLVAEAARAETGQDALVVRAGQLAQPAPTLEATRSNHEAIAFLRERPELEAVAIVREEVPVGLLTRTAFLEAYGKPFAKELYGSRSCETWMDPRPLVVEATTPIEVLVMSAVGAGSKALKDGFVVTQQGKYLGLGSGFELMKAMSAIELAKTRQLFDSIDYASRIQRAQLWSSDRELGRALPDHALVWEPRDVVGGDCYFFRGDDRGLFGAVLDCTGHGVPGAFMSLIVLSYVKDLGGGVAGHDPGAVLAGLNRHIKRVLGQSQTHDESDRAGGHERPDDGLDGLCFHLRADGRKLVFAGAKVPLLVMTPGNDPVVLDGDRQSVGYASTPDDHRWTNHEVPVVPGTRFAVATDGVTDQIGGDKRLGFGRRRLVELVAGTRQASAAALSPSLTSALRAWQGGEPRRDDVTFFAATVPS